MKLNFLHLLRWLRPVFERPLPGFDSVYYLYWYKDVGEAGLDPRRHYLERGWKEGRDPSAGFSTLGYLAANQDVAAAGVNPLLHFVEIGFAEGRVGYTKDQKSIAPQPAEPGQRPKPFPILSLPNSYGSRPLQGFLDEANHESLWGWVLSAVSPHTPPEVEIWVDHCLIGTVLADKFRPDMENSDYDQPNHGFEYSFYPPLNVFQEHNITIQRAVDKLVIGQKSICAGPMTRLNRSRGA